MDSVVTAGCTNGMVETAEPRETVVDVDRTALLGGEPAETACGVDEGDKTGRKDLQLPKAEFYCEETNQRNENANRNVPIAYRLPLEGEWTGYASSEASDPKSNENASNAAIEHADGSHERCRLADVDGVMLEGCNGGTSERMSVDEADGDPGREVEPADSPNEPEALVTMSIEPEDLDSGGIPRIRLGGTRMWTGDANGPGDQADGTMGEMDASNTSNRAEMAGISSGEGVGTYLEAGSAKRIIDTTDGIESHADTLSRHMDVPNVQTDVKIPRNAPDTVSIPHMKAKLPDLPFGTTKQIPDEPYGCRDHADVSNTRTDTYSIGNSMETAANETQNIRMRQTDSRTQDSPSMREIAKSKRTYRWKQVSIGDVDVYVPQNAPVEALGTTNRTIVFGRVETVCEGRVKAIALSVKSERAGDSNSDLNRSDGDVGDTTSGGGVHSARVKAALLAVGSQHMYQSRRIQNGDLPMSSVPPIHHTDRLNGLVIPQCGCRRIKFASINVSQVQKVGTTYPEHIRLAQPLQNDPKHCLKVIGPCRRRDRHKIKPVKLKNKHISVNRAREDEITHLGHARTAQLRGYSSIRAYGVIGPKCRRGHIKTEPRHVSRM